MAFVKIVQTGSILETYSYEFSPAPRVRRSAANIVRDALVSREVVTEKDVFYLRKSRRLERNIYRSRKSFLRLVQGNLYGIPPALLTLTYAENMGDIVVAYRDFTKFALILRKKYPDIKFIGVPEFQKRGAVHFHILLWGYPPSFTCTGEWRFFRGPTDLKAKKHFVHDCPPEKECERNTRYLAKRWGRGFCDLVPTDGRPALGGYLAKYMSKAMSDFRLAGKRAYTSSRNLVRPVSISSGTMPVAVDFVLKDFGIDDLSIALSNREQIFQSKWLGRGVYKLFTRDQLDV